MGLNRDIKQLEYKVGDYIYSRLKKKQNKTPNLFFPRQRKLKR